MICNCRFIRESRCETSIRDEPAPGTAFAADGQSLSVHDSTGTIQATSAVLSSLGYSGEFFDAAAQQQYLRTRFYNPANGRFNRLDPFAGNMQDPQSLHKYAYVHGDPIQGVDPTGLSLDGNEQPFNLRLGNAAHRAIQADYEDWAFIHNKDVVTEPYNSSFQNLIRPDLLNKSDFLVGEIKPFSVPSISAGYAKLIASKSLLNGQTAVYGGKSIPAPQSGPLLGKTSWDFETWAPGLKGFKVYLLPSIEEHLVVTLGNWKGLVVYKRFRQRKAETLHEFAARAEREAVRVVGVADVNSDGRLTGNEVDVASAQWEFLNPVHDLVEAVATTYLALVLARALVSAVAFKATTSRLGSASI